MNEWERTMKTSSSSTLPLFIHSLTLLLYFCQTYIYSNMIFWHPLLSYIYLTPYFIFIFCFYHFINLLHQSCYYHFLFISRCVHPNSMYTTFSISISFILFFLKFFLLFLLPLISIIPLIVWLQIDTPALSK